MILRSSRRLLLSFIKPPQVPTSRNNSSLLGCFLRHASTKPAAVCRLPARWPLPGRYYTTSQAQPIDSRTRWYHSWLKIASVAALVSGATAAIAVYRPYLDLEVVPYTNRTHVVYLSPQSERELWRSRLDEDKKKWAAKSRIVDPLHPDSVRVRLILEKLIRAAHCTLGVGSDDIVVRHGGSSCKDDDVKTRPRTQRRNASQHLQPHAGHLPQLQWEVIIVKDKEANAIGTAGGKIVVFTGLLNKIKTDAEIAFVLGHEVGHIIARHDAEIAKHKWFPILLWPLFFRTMEIEADHIGIMLLGAAGFHPYTALIALWNLAKADTRTRLQTFRSPFPSFKKRSQYLSQPKVMLKAMEFYKEATTDQDVGNKSARVKVSLSEKNL